MPSHNARCHDYTKGPLSVVTEPVQTRLGKSLQLNWTLPTTPRSFTIMYCGSEMTSNVRGNLHNLIGDLDACSELYTTTIGLQGTSKLLGNQRTQEEQALRYQAPKSNKLLKLHFHVSPWRTQTMHKMQWQGHTECPSASLPNPSTTTNAMEETKTKNEE